ncbi:uncharacterized membrane protein At1g75140 [Diospyros lotus]|uniref:uncharacterized membrane protein At1g75140 n=1 Tax=Diospyros lotus TaxID=55363 RepID=UPI002256184C|nr:uncharacterized membrane protein At1g75140 [Diospyros lotus]
MATCEKGKFFISICFLFLLVSPSRAFVNSNSAVNQKGAEDENRNHADESSVLDQHRRLLEQLEEMVRNLSELVSRLDSRLPETPRAGRVDEKHSVEETNYVRGNVKIDSNNYEGGHLVEGIKESEDGLDGGKVRDGERPGAVSITKYSPFWSEGFHHVSALKLNFDATCINVLPFRDYEGLSKYVAVGNAGGKVYVFLRNGDVAAEFYTLSDSPITAMLSYMSVYKNESFVVTGHSNGLISMHRVWEASSGEEWTSLSTENVRKFAIEENVDDGSSITMLEVHHVGRIRYLLCTDVSGKIRVFRENGMLHGLGVPTRRPLAFLKQRLLFLTGTGAGSLDLRTMRIRETECEGLNQSSVERYVFDATDRSKAYGFTSQGDLIHVLLLGDIVNFKCRVRFKRKFEMDKPLALQAIKGYLLIVNQEKVFVYNVSSMHYVRAGGPRFLFSAGFDEIRSSFLHYQPMHMDKQKRTEIPLLASDHEKFVILGLGGGYLGMYRSNLPVFKGEFNTMLWTSPLFFFVLFLFGAWQFFAKKKEALTSWGPDDPFTSTSISNAVPLGSGPVDRSFNEAPRTGDVMDLRGGGIRGQSRRFVSPSGYHGGSASSYRPTVADANSRPSVDPNYRTPSELKFRGSNLESTGFHKRRESFFANNSVVDDSH